MVSSRVPPLKVVVSTCLCNLEAVWLASSVLLMDVFDRKTNCLWHNPLLTLTVSLLIQSSMSQSTQFTGSYSCSSLSSPFQLFWGAVMLLLFNGCVLRGVVMSGKDWLCVTLFWSGQEGEFCIAQCNSFLKNLCPRQHPVLQIWVRLEQLSPWLWGVSMGRH